MLVLTATHRDFPGCDKGSDPLEQYSVGTHPGKDIKTIICQLYGLVSEFRWNFLLTVSFELQGKAGSLF